MTKAEKQEAIERCREWMPEGTTVYCIVRRVAASGMSRNIQLVYFAGPNDDRHPTYSAALAMGRKVVNVNGHDTIRINGCGMDMCQALIDGLSHTLHGKPGALKCRTI